MITEMQVSRVTLSASTYGPSVDFHFHGELTKANIEAAVKFGLDAVVKVKEAKVAEDSYVEEHEKEIKLHLDVLQVLTLVPDGPIKTQYIHFADTQVGRIVVSDFEVLTTNA